MMINALSTGVSAEIVKQDSRFLTNHLDPTCGGILWSILKPDAPQRITQNLLSQIRSIQVDLLTNYSEGKRLNYHVFSSDIPNVFSLGGDLGFFCKCVQENDRDKLIIYAKASIDLVYTTATNYHLPITTIALVKGAALGGGFEAALSANYIIAEKQSMFAFPETRFGLFPGMGAYTFLRQRVPNHIAEDIIYSSRQYSAEELYEMQIIDQLCETGQGYKTTMQFMQKRQHRHQGIQAMREMAQVYSPIDRKELDGIVDHWVDCVMNLNIKQRRLLNALAKTK